MISEKPSSATTQAQLALKAIRQDLKRRQRDMAEALGIHLHSYKKWERGERGVSLSFEQIVTLERELNSIGKRFSDYWPPTQPELPN
jgi:transcriptional regulator with XRE-family HTH domain